MNVSIIIITRNRIKLLKSCLESINKSNLNISEIIVIDNNSSDGTVKYLRERKDLVVIFNKKNRGVSYSRNQGIKRARTEFLVFLDDDTEITKSDNFNKIFSYFKNNPDVAMVVPKILYPNGESQESVRRFPTLLAVLWRGTILRKFFPNSTFYQSYFYSEKEFHKPAKVDWVIGACTIARKDTLERVGNYDPKYFYVYDDIDICYRLNISGFKVVYYPLEFVIHKYQRVSAQNLISKQKFSHIFSILFFFYKKIFIYS